MVSSSCGEGIFDIDQSFSVQHFVCGKSPFLRESLTLFCNKGDDSFVVNIFFQFLLLLLRK